MADDPTKYYRTVADADAYFEDQLFANDWTSAAAGDKYKALLAATRAVDKLRFKGQKKTVYDLLATNPDATQIEIDQADANQRLEFPRDDQDVDTVPDEVFHAVCEEAVMLIAGHDPQVAYCNLPNQSSNAAGINETFDRARMGQAHIRHLLASPLAWALLVPFLKPENSTFKINPGGV